MASKARRLNTEDQFIFLISCIRHHENGKVDFGKVAEECEIVSKGAAAKRYERLMKAHGIHQSSPQGRDTGVPPLRQPSDGTPSKTRAQPRATPKKRKRTKKSPSSSDDEVKEDPQKKLKMEDADEDDGPDHAAGASDGDDNGGEQQDNGLQVKEEVGEDE